jgi:hypothetical protein
MNSEGKVDVIDLSESVESGGKNNVKSDNNKKEKFQAFQIVPQY